MDWYFWELCCGRRWVIRWMFTGANSLIRVLGDSPVYSKQLYRMNGEGFDIVDGETPDEVRMVALPEHLARLTELDTATKSFTWISSASTPSG